MMGVLDVFGVIFHIFACVILIMFMKMSWHDGEGDRLYWWMAWCLPWCFYLAGASMFIVGIAGGI